MCDLLAIRNRLMAAMGFVAAHAGAGCASPSAPATPAADLTPGGNFDVAPDGADTKTKISDGTAVDLFDAAPDNLHAVADPGGRAEVMDAAAQPDVVDAGVDCPGGKSPSPVCMGAEQVKALAEYQGCVGICKGPPEPDTSDGGIGIPQKDCKTTYSGPLPPEGCPSILVNAECSGYVDGYLDANACCYVYCSFCTCGRPFVVDGRVLTAETVPASSWSARDIDAATVPTATDCALAAAWRADALDEHASVASFHQFGLELLAVGAPPDLVRDAALAAAEEVEHARACLAIATRLDGADAGTDKLGCGGVKIHGDIKHLAVATVRESCIGETLSAALARHAAADATDARVAQALAAMADDELRHSELAWRFVKWALAQGGESVADAVAPPLPMPSPPARRLMLGACSWSVSRPRRCVGRAVCRLTTTSAWLSPP